MEIFFLKKTWTMGLKNYGYRGILQKKYFVFFQKKKNHNKSVTG